MGESLNQRPTAIAAEIARLLETSPSMSQSMPTPNIRISFWTCCATVNSSLLSQ
jgi:hypothetical protein